MDVMDLTADPRPKIMEIASSLHPSQTSAVETRSRFVTHLRDKGNVWTLKNRNRIVLKTDPRSLPLLKRYYFVMLKTL